MLHIDITVNGIPKQQPIMKNAYDGAFAQLQKQKCCAGMYEYSAHPTSGGNDSTIETLTQPAKENKKIPLVPCIIKIALLPWHSFAFGRNNNRNIIQGLVC